MFNNELEKLMDSKKELNEDERKQFKKDFTFIKKNIDNGEIDFKAFPNPQSQSPIPNPHYILI